MSYKIYLPVVDDADGAKDAIVHFAALPGMKGSDDESLACGKCKAVLCQNVSTRSLYSKFVVENRLIIACTCGAHNVIPSQKDVP